MKADDQVVDDQVVIDAYLKYMKDDTPSWGFALVEVYGDGRIVVSSLSDISEKNRGEYIKFDITNLDADRSSIPIPGIIRQELQTQGMESFQLKEILTLPPNSWKAGPPKNLRPGHTHMIRIEYKETDTGGVSTSFSPSEKSWFQKKRSGPDRSKLLLSFPGSQMQTSVQQYSIWKEVLRRHNYVPPKAESEDHKSTEPEPEIQMFGMHGAEIRDASNIRSV